MRRGRDWLFLMSYLPMRYTLWILPGNIDLQSMEVRGLQFAQLSGGVCG